MPESISLIFASVTILLFLFAAHVWHTDPRAALNRSLALFCLLMALGNLGQVFTHLAESAAQFAFWYRVSWLGWAFYPAAAIQVALFMAEYRWLEHRRWLLPLLYLPGLFFAVAVQFSLIGIRELLVTDSGRVLPVFSYGPLDLAFPYYQYAFDLVALAIIGCSSFTSGSQRRHRQAVIILLAALIAIGMDAFRYLKGPRGELALMWAGEQLIFVFGLAYAITYLKFATPTAALAADYIMARVQDLVVLLDNHGTVLEANAAACRVLGREKTDIVGQPLSHILRALDGRPLDWPLPGRAAEGGAGQEIYFVTGEGEEIPVWLTSSRVRDSFNDIVGNVLIGEDLRYTKTLQAEIAERQRAEEGLRQADRAKDTFLATLSHEMLTPLTGVLVWTKIAQQDPEQLPHALQIIDDNARQQHRLVQDMLDVSRIVHGKITLEPEPTDLNEQVWHCAEQHRHQAEARQLTLRYHLCAEPVPVEVDVIRLRQVLANLLLNAVKFTPAGGAVTMTVTKDAEQAVLTVADTGSGIAPELLPLLFAPFMQGRGATTRGGLGLGLAVAHGLVHLHGGTLTAASPGEGQGSTFTLTLPLLAGDVPLEPFDVTGRTGG